jgi:hypothetical protein
MILACGVVTRRRMLMVPPAAAAAVVAVARAARARRQVRRPRPRPRPRPLLNRSTAARGSARPWDVRLTDAHGVRRYPLGPAVSIDLSGPPRRAPDPPGVEAAATAPVELEVRWAGGSRVSKIGR